MKRKPSLGTTESTLSDVSKDEWNRKEGTSKSMKNAYCVMPKGTSLAQATGEKIKHIVLTIVELCWSEGIRQLVSQSVQNSVK